MGTDACCPSAILAVACAEKNQEPPFEDPETPAAVGQELSVSADIQIARKRSLPSFCVNG